jgi:hypothetical protein
MRLICVGIMNDLGILLYWTRLSIDDRIAIMYAISVVQIINVKLITQNYG